MPASFDNWEGQFLCHHGIKGQRWGIRRYQNPDGSLTEAGKKRQQKELYKSIKKEVRQSRKEDNGASIGNRVAKKLSIKSDDMNRLSALGKKWDTIGERANNAKNSAYHKTVHMKKALSKAEKLRLTKLMKSDHDAMTSYVSEHDRVVSDLIGKYGERKIREKKRQPGHRSKTKTKYIVDQALTRALLEYNKK